MNAKILAKFNNGDITYVYYTVANENNKILYGYLDGDSIRSLKTYKEFLMMQQAQKKIFISTDPENHVELGYTIFKNKLFKILYDKSSELKFFYEVKDGKDYFPSEEDSRELFKIHNPVNRYQEEPTEENTSKKGKLKKTLIDILFVLEAAVFGASLGTIAVALFDKYVQPETPVTEIVSVEKYESPKYYGEIGDDSLTESTSKGEFSEERLLQAIKDNENLNDVEREMLESKIPILKKYQKYAHFNHVENKFRTLRTNYILEPPPEDIGVSAYYNTRDNIIVVYYGTSIYDCDLSDFSHEAEHLITEPHESLGSALYEATTENISFEQEYSQNFSYYYECLFERILLQIIPPEMVAADHFSGDLSYITDELIKIIPSEELAYQLLHAIDSVNNNNWTIIRNRDLNTEESKQLYEEATKMLKYNMELTRVLLNKYFTVVKGYPIEQDFICLNYLKQLGMVDDKIFISIPSENIDNTEFNNQSIKKGYFVDSYIEKYDMVNINLNVFVDFVPDGHETDDTVKVPTVANAIIDESNRKMSTITDGSGYLLELSKLNEIDFNVEFGSGLLKGLENVIYRENNPGEWDDSYLYLEQSTYVKMLCEIIGTKPFESYLETKNIEEITSALYKIIPDKDRICNLIANIDITNRYYETNSGINRYDFTSQPGIETVGDIDENLREARGKIYTELCRYFYEKKGYDLEEDVLMNAYYSQLTKNFSFECYKFIWPITFNFDYNEKLSSDSYSSLTVNKAYFDEEYKNSVPHPFIVIEGYNRKTKGEVCDYFLRTIQVKENERRMERVHGEDIEAHFEFEAKEIKKDKKM